MPHGAEAWLVGLARVGPVVVWLMSLGAGGWMVRLLLAAGIVAVVGPAVMPAGVDHGQGVLAVTLAYELVVGLLLGAAAALPLRALQAWGGLLDFGGLAWRRGVDEGEPGGDEPGMLERTAGLLALVVFVSLGGVEVVMGALAESYRILPIGGVPAPRGLGLAIALGGRLIALAVTAALPVLATAALVRLVVAVMGRLEGRIFAGVGEATAASWTTLVAVLAVVGTIAAVLVGSGLGRLGQELARLAAALAGR